MKLYTIVHTHDEGITVYLLYAERRPTVREVVTKLDINYEPHREESLELEAHDPQTIPTL